MKSSLKTYKRMLGFLKPYMHLFIISAVLSVAIVSFNGMSIWFLGSLPQTLFKPDTVITVKPALSLGTINEYLKYVTLKLTRNTTFDNPITLICLLIVITFTLKNILLYINKLVLKRLDLNVVRDMRNLLYRHVLLLPVTYYDRNKSGNLVSHILNDIAQINRSMADTLIDSIMEPMHLIFFITMLFIINVKLTIIIFVIYPILSFFIIKIGKSVKRRGRRSLENLSGMISVLTETIQGIRAVKMFNMNNHEAEKFEGENKKFIRSSYKAEKAKALLVPLVETLGVYVSAILLWYGSKESLSGSANFTPEDFFRFLFFLFSSYKPFKTIGTINNHIQTGIAAAERVFKLLNTPAEDLRAGTAKSNGHGFKQGIRFDKVSFKYPTGKDFVLQDLSFSVKKGEIIAIVGSSGAGKSTILDLLPRFYDISGGTISIDGKDIRDINLFDLRDMFGIVSQETILFNDTVANNLRYGSNDANIDRIKAAAEAANAMEFIARMPQGFDTVIGEQGAMLSGGQRQRLSIARALLKNPPILIFDEATSALDTESERLVQTAIDNLIHNRTTFVVAHRLSTIRHANTIIVLEGGKIIEQGAHAELLALNKRYKYFYDIQFSTTA